jgi:hypothetical protein
MKKPPKSTGTVSAPAGIMEPFDAIGERVQNLHPLPVSRRLANPCPAPANERLSRIEGMRFRKYQNIFSFCENF